MLLGSLLTAKLFDVYYFRVLSWFLDTIKHNDRRDKLWDKSSLLKHFSLVIKSPVLAYLHSWWKTQAIKFLQFSYYVLIYVFSVIIFYSAKQRTFFNF